MDEPPVFPFRPQALAAYRDAPPDQVTSSPLRATRWPLAALAVLLLGCLAFAGTVRLPQAVNGTVIGTDGPYLVAVFAGRLSPHPERGAEATVREEHGRTTLRVVRTETVEGDAGRWNIPPQVARPVTVVLLTGHSSQSLGPISLRVAEPTLFQLLTGAGRTDR